MATVLRDRNSRSPISRKVRCVCRYGSRRSSAGVRGGPAPLLSAPVRGQQRAQGRDLVDEATQVRSMGQDLVDLAPGGGAPSAGRPGSRTPCRVAGGRGRRRGAARTCRRVASAWPGRAGARLRGGRPAAQPAGPPQRRRARSWRSRSTGTPRPDRAPPGDAPPRRPIDRGPWPARRARRCCGRRCRSCRSRCRRPRSPRRAPPPGQGHREAAEPRPTGSGPWPGTGSTAALRPRR